MITCDNKYLSARDLLRLIVRTDDGAYFSDCDNKEYSFYDAFKQCIVMGSDGYPALKVGGDTTLFCDIFWDEYVAYVTAQGGYIEDTGLARAYLCELIADTLFLVDEDGNYILDESGNYIYV